MNLKQLLYVDSDESIVKPGQIPLEWIKDAQLLKGATIEKPRGGNLNQNPVALQKNIQILDENINTLSEGLDTTDEKVQKIIDDLGASLDQTLVETVSDHNIKINQNSLDIKTNKDNIEIEKERIDSIKNELGEPTPQSIIRAVHDDLYWIKQRIGNKKDEDINGTPAYGDVGSGLMYKADVALEAASQTIKTVGDFQDQLTTNKNAINDETVRATNVEKGLQDQINTIGSTVLIGYNTYAEMEADSANIKINTIVKVTADVDSSKNGDWQWNGTTFTKSLYDPVHMLEESSDLRARNEIYPNLFNVNEVIGEDISRISNKAVRPLISKSGTKTIRMFTNPNDTTEFRWRFSAAYFKQTNTISISARIKNLTASVGAAVQAVKLVVYQTNATGGSIKSNAVTIAGPEAITVEKSVKVENVPLDANAVFVEFGFSIHSVGQRELLVEDICINQSRYGFYVAPAPKPVNLFPDPLFTGQFTHTFHGIAKKENEDTIMTFAETEELRQSLWQIPALGQFSPGSIVRFGSEVSSNKTGSTHVTLIFFDIDNKEIFRTTQESRVVNDYDILSSEYVVPNNAARVDVRLMKDTNSTIAKFRRPFLYSYSKNAYSFTPQFPLTILYVDALKGSDMNNGTINAPIKSLTRAMVMAGYYTRIIVNEGNYYECPLVTSKIGVLEVMAARNAKVRIIGGTKLTGFTKTEGYNKVWQIPQDDPLLASDRSAFWLFHHGVPDETSLINDEDRVSYHEGRKYRLPDFTRIWKTTSVAKIESETVPSWFWEDGVLYLSCAGFGDPNVAEIRIPDKIWSPFYTSAITKDQRIKLVGLESFYWLNGFRTWDFSSVEMSRCRAFGNRVNGFEHSNSMYVSRDNCESGASWVDGTGAHVHTAQGRPNPSGQSCIYMGMNNYEHDTGDDGQSLHEYWRGVDYGGFMEDLGDRGIVPAVGGHSVVHNMHIRRSGVGYDKWPIDDGAAYGCVGRSTDGGTTTNMELHNCIAENCRISVNSASDTLNINVINAWNFKSIDPIVSHFNASKGVINLKDATFSGSAPLKVETEGGKINVKNTEKVT